jgi:hypothetical protein
MVIGIHEHGIHSGLLGPPSLARLRLRLDLGEIAMLFRKSAKNHAKPKAIHSAISLCSNRAAIIKLEFLSIFIGDRLNWPA